MRKIKLVNKERFQNFLATIGLAIVIGLAVNNPTQGTISKWHDAIDEGMSWNEYMEVNN
jgi:hypothetical protein